MSKTIINKAQLDSAIWTNENLIAGNNISITKVQKPEIDDNTMALYHFDEGTADEISGETYTAGTVTYGPGKFGNAIRPASNITDSHSQYIRTAGDFTLDCWLKPATSGRSVKIGLTDGGDVGTIEFGTGSSKRLIIGGYLIGGSYIDTTYPNAITADTEGFTHLAYEIYGQLITVFINGQIAYQTSTDVGAVGLYGLYTSTYTDEVRISNIARYRGQDFTPFDKPYAVADSSSQYQINSTASIAPIVQTYSNNTGTTLATGLTLANYSTIMIYKNGMLLSETKDDSDSAAHDYTISINDIVFTTALESNDTITIFAI